MIFKSFLIGSRFDLIVTSYLLLPLAFWLLIPRYGWQYQPFLVRILPWVLSVFWSPLVFLGLAEWEFYREFHDRFNQLALHYIADDPSTVVSMIWHGYPVIPYMIVWSLVVLFLGFGLKRIMNRISHLPDFTWNRHLKTVLPAGLVVIVLLAAGSRGGFQSGPPLRWGDAYFSRHTFANHLALNGIFTLARAAIERDRRTIARYWEHRLPEQEARMRAQKLVLQRGDRFAEGEAFPLLRYPGKENRTLAFSHAPRHLVVILMESLSAEFVGALGAPYHATPEFDRIAGQGILFDHFFSQGTHTHQALFAVIASFPNLPGYEYLMQNGLGQQPFRSFITMLKEEGFQSVYVYNGSFTWDNQEGFFRNQGMQHFVGRDDFVNPRFKDPTWGVSDEDMFLRGVEEMSRLTRQGRTFVFLQTLSNHAPFDLPPPAPFADLTGPAQLLPRLNGIRYGDWSLGRFFELAEKEPWFGDTLFVIIGDHGFAYNAPQASMDLSSYHVPFLIYYPGDHQRQGRRISAVGSHVDVMPTIMGLMGISGVHQSWGRDLFRLTAEDLGWAVIKPSGSSQVVGFIEGDRMLVLSPRLAPAAYRFKLNPWNATQDTLPMTEVDRLSKYLHAYVETALLTLASGHAGAPQQKHERSRRL